MLIADCRAETTDTTDGTDTRVRMTYPRYRCYPWSVISCSCKPRTGFELEIRTLLKRHEEPVSACRSGMSCSLPCRIHRATDARLKSIFFTFLLPGTVTVLVPYFIVTNRISADPQAGNFVRYLGAADGDWILRSCSSASGTLRQSDAARLHRSILPKHSSCAGCTGLSEIRCTSAYSWCSRAKRYGSCPGNSCCSPLPSSDWSTRLSCSTKSRPCGGNLASRMSGTVSR